MLLLMNVSDEVIAAQNDGIDILLKEIANGNTGALESLYEKVSSSVYAFSLSILKNAHDAEDVMQSCFVKIFSHAYQYRSQHKPMAWILTITKNLCYEKMREKKRDDKLGEIHENDSYFVDLTADDRIVVDFCLNSLSDDERQILVLHAVSGFKHREIALLLKLPLGSVLSKYHRAIKKVKTHLEGGKADD